MLAGIKPGNQLDLTPVDCNLTSRLVMAAHPVLEQLADALDGVLAGGLLVDRAATVVDRYFGHPQMRAAADRLGAQPGVSFLEERAGTNAIGTARETREPIFVFSHEHFLDVLKGYSCYGVPIMHPVTGRLEGVIGLMVATSTEPGVMASLINRAASDIATRLLEDADPALVHSVAAFRRLSRRVDGGLTLLGPDFIVHNSRAADLITPMDVEALVRLSAELTVDHSTEFILDAGTVVTVTAADRTSHTVLLRIDDGVRQKASVPRSSGSTRSPIERRLDELAGGTGNVYIEGELGSGRTRAGRQVGTAGARYCTISEHTSIAEINRVLDDAQHGALIVDDIHLAEPATIDALSRRAHETGDVRLVITATPAAGKNPSLDYLASLCPQWVQLPPLRERIAEVTGIAEGIVRAIVAQREIRLPPPRFSRAARESLRTYPWPGNIAELASLLAAVVALRVTGDIVPSDFPDRYQRHAGPAAGLSPLESQERDLIIKALALFQGNKVRSALHLGISRSTLYARLRYFKLE